MSVGDYWFLGQLIALEFSWSHTEVPILQTECALREHSNTMTLGTAHGKFGQNILCLYSESVSFKTSQDFIITKS